MGIETNAPKNEKIIFMNNEIRKYVLPAVRGEHKLHLSAGAQILKVGNQYEKITLWCEVDTNEPSVERQFLLLYTGDPINPCTTGRYLDTVLLDGGATVLHIYEQYVHKKGTEPKSY